MLDLQAALRTCRDYRRNGGSRNIGVTGAVIPSSCGLVAERVQQTGSSASLYVLSDHSS